jgi:hypothetical protein
MDEKKLANSLRQIESLVTDCLREVGKKKLRAPSQMRTSAGNVASENTLPSRLIRLREEGFFNQPQTASETHEKLQPEYPCEIDRIAMALLRLFKGKKLRKASKLVRGTRQIAYVW